MMAEQTPQRETAKICSVKELISGKYIIQEGWLPNYVQSKNEKLSRINIIGIVVSKPSPYNFSIDDGSGTIQVVDFNQQQKVAKLRIGEPVMIIGRPRQNEGTLFIACELVNAKQLINDSNWILYRKEQLSNRVVMDVSVEETIQETPVLREPETNELVVNVKHDEVEETINTVKEEKLVADVTGEDIISFIKKKDSGEGCLIEDIISYFGNDIDDHVLTLITMGEIYEIKPGKVKVLE